MDGAPACPFVAFGDDRDGRSTSPDHRHRCFAESPPAPRAVAHQEAYCLSSAFPVCPTFQDWAKREAAHARGAGDRAETAPTAVPVATTGERVDEIDRDEPPPARGGRGPRARATRRATGRRRRPGRRVPRARAGHRGPRRGGRGGRRSAREPHGRGTGSGRQRRGSAGGRSGPCLPRPRVGRPRRPARPRRPRTTSLPVSSRGGRRRTSSPPRIGRLSAPDAGAPDAARRQLDPAVRRPDPRPVLGADASLRGLPDHQDAGPAARAAARTRIPGRPGRGDRDRRARPVHAARAARGGRWRRAGRSGPSRQPAAAVRASPTVKPGPTPQIYIVKKGDTMSKIAKTFGVTVEEIMAANPDIKNPNKIAAGSADHHPRADPDTRARRASRRCRVEGRPGPRRRCQASALRGA